MNKNFPFDTVLNSTPSELASIKKFIENNHDNEERMVKVDKYLDPLIPIYSYDYFSPFWLEKPCKFEDDIWVINLTKNKKILDFSNVIFSDNSKLVEHLDLLNIFKLWLTISVSPTYNNGSFLSKAAINNRLNQIITLINNLIINEENNGLLSLRTLVLNEYYFIDLLINLNQEGFDNAFYNLKRILHDYLLKNIDSIKDDEVKDFEKKFPLIEENYDFSEFNFSLDQIRKSRCYLYKIGGYKKNHTTMSYPTGFFLKSLYENKTIDNLSIHFSPIKCLALYSEKSLREFKIFNPNLEGDEDSILGLKTVEKYVQSINFLSHVQYFYDSLGSHNFKFQYLEIESIKRHISLKPLNRFLTAPAEVVFDILRKSFEFIFEFMDDILDYYLKIQLELNITFEQSIKKIKKLA